MAVCDELMLTLQFKRFVSVELQQTKNAISYQFSLFSKMNDLSKYITILAQGFFSTEITLKCAFCIQNDRPQTKERIIL